MRTRREYLDYYNSQVLPHVKILEKERVKVVFELIVFFTIYIPFGLYIMFASIPLGAKIFWVVSEEIFRGSLPLMLLSCLIPFLFPLFCFTIVYNFGLFVYGYLTKQYHNYFKEKVIRKLLYFLGNDVSYSPKGSMSIKDWQQVSSHLNPASTKEDVLLGNDLVYGAEGAVNFRFSDIKVFSPKDSDVGSLASLLISTRIGMLFLPLLALKVVKNKSQFFDGKPSWKGFFFVSDFNKNIKYNTYINCNSRDERTPLVKNLENKIFSRNFFVRSENDVEARYILTPDFMDRMVNLTKTVGRRIQVVFKGSHVYILLPGADDMLEPPVFNTLKDFAEVKKFYEEIYGILGIIECLDLTTDIWGKNNMSNIEWGEISVLPPKLYNVNGEPIDY